MKKKHHTNTTRQSPPQKHNHTTQHHEQHTHSDTNTHIHRNTKTVKSVRSCLTPYVPAWQHEHHEQRKLNPANMKIKAIESSEYANWIRRCPKKIIFKCNKIPRQKQGNSNSYKKCNKFSTTSRIQRIWKLGQLNPANMKSKAIESSEYANQA